ncbi:Eukaryotic translation initiation factor 6-2 [Platanthera guangdongensis]|uniref:Eukaryotic translation initiation factor 6-2 n=1 Tax=Platanthera guangdongensis TaxID=2320717 RepID=A0ABR2LV98_9ASPA
MVLRLRVALHFIRLSVHKVRIHITCFKLEHSPMTLKSPLLFGCARAMAMTRHKFEKCCDIGIFSKLTNAYCLVTIGGSENFYRFVP